MREEKKKAEFLRGFFFSFECFIVDCRCEVKCGGGSVGVFFSLFLSIVASRPTDVFFETNKQKKKNGKKIKKKEKKDGKLINSRMSKRSCFEARCGTFTFTRTHTNGIGEKNIVRKALSAHLTQVFLSMDRATTNLPQADIRT